VMTGRSRAKANDMVIWCFWHKRVKANKEKYPNSRLTGTVQLQQYEDTCNFWYTLYH
jgi:hypothetical protein